MRELHALRRPGGAGGVDQRRDVGRLAPRARPPRSPDGRRRAGRPRARRCARRRGASTARIVSAKRALGDHDAVLGVGEQVLDLLGRRGVVDENGVAPRCSAAVSMMWNSGRLTSIIPTVSPRPTPSAARPPAIRSTRCGVLAPRSASARRPACAARARRRSAPRVIWNASHSVAPAMPRRLLEVHGPVLHSHLDLRSRCPRAIVARRFRAGSSGCRRTRARGSRRPAPRRSSARAAPARQPPRAVADAMPAARASR